MFIIFNNTRKVENMITELSLALEQYIGLARRGGVYNFKTKPLVVQTLERIERNVPYKTR